VIDLGFAETVVLGAIAGFTIYLGLPMGRIRHVDDRLRVALAMFSVGILAFIFMDVTSHGEAILSTTLGAFKDGKASFAHVLGLFALLAAGFTVGTAGISAVERSLRRRRAAVPRIAGASPEAAVIPSGLGAHRSAEADARRTALRTGMTIAVAIGLHNFAEGLAIGVSARAGAIGLATVLIIGFGLHNSTEGFGIVGPLGGVRPSWTWIGLVGLVGGGPTLLGTIVGYQVHSDPLELCFYALAGGAILYVVGEIWTAVRRYGYRTLGLYLLAFGFLVGVATDLVVSYGGA
jgi:ZIP family zinc transporter